MHDYIYLAKYVLQVACAITVLYGLLMTWAMAKAADKETPKPEAK